MNEDLYRALGVEADANRSQIRLAYRQLIARCHPDRHGGRADMAAKTARLNVAAGVLLDPDLRAAYDRRRLSYLRAQAHGETAATAPATSGEWWDRSSWRGGDWVSSSAGARPEENVDADFRDRGARWFLHIHCLVQGTSPAGSLASAAAGVFTGLAFLMVAHG